MRARHTTRPPQDRPGAFGADLDEVPGQGVLVGGGRRGGTGGGGGVHGILGSRLVGYRRYPEDLEPARRPPGEGVRGAVAWVYGPRPRLADPTRGVCSDT